MKRYLLLAVSTALLIGCATTQNPNYMAYIAAAQRPLVQVDVDEQGRVKSFTVGNPFVQQEKDHPGWRVADRAVGVVGVVGGIWAAGEFIMKPMFNTFGSFANAPNSVSTYNQSGSGNALNVGSGSAVSATSTPTIVPPSYPPTP